MIKTFSKLKYNILALLFLSFSVSFVFQMIHRHYWLLPNLYELEREIDIKDVKRLAYAIGSLDDVLAAHVADNSIWDELYFAIAKRDIPFIEKTFFQGEQFANLGINGYAFFDADANLLSHHSVDNQLNPIAIKDVGQPTAENLPFLTVSAELVAANNLSRTGRSGLIFFDGRPVVFATSSIHRSNNKGESIGSMLVWRFADQRVVTALRASSQLDVSVRLVDDSSSNLSHLASFNSIDQQMTKIKRDEQHNIAMLVDDILGNAVAILEFKAHPRKFVDSTFDFGTLSLLLLVLILFGFIYFGINHLVLTPTKQILRWIDKVMDSGEFSQSHKVNRASEFKSIEQQLNKLMTYLTDQERELVHAKNEAEQANEHKSMFLANMSHEIRTPLHGILNLADLAQHETDIQQKNLKLKNIYNSGNILMNIVNDVLDFSKIEAGKLDVEEVEFDVRALVESVLAPLRALADDKNIQLTAMVSHQITKVLKGDPVRVAQILNNLCSNAIKFTSEGSVKLVVSVNQDNEDSQAIKFEVVDTGIGIEEEKQSLLFDEFQQVDTSTARKYGGTGLGLSICAKLSEIMGGTLSFSSVPGQGSQFCYSQTFAVSVKAFKANDDVTPVDLKHAKVLVAEDNMVNQTIIAAMLKRHNAEVVIVDNGVKCVEHFKANPVDIILMDIQMPEMDGVQACKAIRQLDKGKEVPILAMTANTLRAEIENYFEIGMDGYLGKPFDKTKFNHLLTIFAPEQSQQNLQSLSANVANPAVSSELKLQEICLQVKNVIPGANRVSLWLFDEHFGQINCIQCLDENNEFSQGLTLSADDFPSYFEYILKSLVLNAADARANEVTNCFNDSYFKPLNIHSLLDYTFHLDNRPAGVICCERVGDKARWTEQDISFLVRVAKLTSLFFAEEVIEQFEDKM